MHKLNEAYSKLITKQNVIPKFSKIAQALPFSKRRGYFSNVFSACKFKYQCKGDTCNSDRQISEMRDPHYFNDKKQRKSVNYHMPSKIKTGSQQNLGNEIPRLFHDHVSDFP